MPPVGAFLGLSAIIEVILRKLLLALKSKFKAPDTLDRGELYHLKSVTLRNVELISPRELFASPL